MSEKPRLGSPALSILLVLFTCSLLAASPSLCAGTGAPSVPWEELRALASSLDEDPAFRPADPPGYRELESAFGERLDSALRAVVGGAGGAAESAFADCHVAARLLGGLYDTSFFDSRLEWARALTYEQAERKLQADSLYAAGRAEKDGGKLSAAEEMFRQALETYEAIGDLRGTTAVQYLLNISKYGEWENDARLAEMYRIAEVSGDAGDWLYLVRALDQAGQLEQDAGRSAKAYALQDSVVALGEFLRDTRVLGFVFVTMGRTLMNWNDPSVPREESELFEEAGEAFRRALEIAKAEGDSAQIVGTLQSIGGVYYRAEDLDSAGAYWQRALDVCIGMGDALKIASLSYNLCLVRWYQDDLEEAYTHCERAVEYAREIGHRWIEGNSMDTIGNILNDLGDWEGAIPWNQGAHEVAVAIEDYPQVCHTLNNIGRAYVKADSFATARKYFEAAMAAADTLPPEILEEGGDPLFFSLMHLSKVARAEGDLDEALSLGGRAYDRSRNDGPDAHLVAQSWSGLTLSTYLLESGDLDSVESILHNVIRAARGIGQRTEIWCASAALAQVEWRRGERDSAIAYLDRALDEIEAAREAVGSLGSREEWFARELGPFDLMIRYRVELGQHEEALSCLERMKARELLDLLEGGHVVFTEDLSAEERAEEESLIEAIERLNRRLADGDTSAEGELARARSDYAAFEEGVFRLYPGLRERRGRGRPITPREARRMMGPDEAALLYSLGAERAILVTVTREAIRGHVLDATTREIRNQIVRLRDAIEEPRGSFLGTSAEALYRVLVAPAREELSGKTRVCFVPDAELYSLPFQALIDPDSGHFLIEDFSVYVAPSLSALGSLRWKGSRGRRDLLAIGDPYFGEKPMAALALRNALAPLPFAAQEVSVIADVYAPRAKVLTSTEATENAFKELAPDYGIIHIASHALIDDGDPLYSSIAFAGIDPREDAFLEAREVMKLQLDADIVVLSACETARGTVTRGEGINGLLRAFFTAGVPTVVASLWPVEDESTAKLMMEFHTRLRDGERPADALAFAERSFLQANSGLRHPYYWAAFLLYGDSE